MNRRSSCAAALAALLLLPGIARASGYNVYEQGVRAMGMAGAATAAVEDASAIFFNPAALPRLAKGTHLHGGFHLLTTNTEFAGSAPYPGTSVDESMNTGTFPLGSVYLAQVESGRWAVGAGVFPAFGLGVDWKQPAQFTGRYLVTKADLRSIDANVTAAWAFNEQWSAGAGFDARFAQVELNRTITNPAYPPGVNVGTVKLSSDYTPGYGWNAGLAFAPAAAWRFGATYRSAIEVEIDDGEADFTALLPAPLPPDQAVGTTLKFPAIWSVGGAWTRDAWTLAADVNLLQWSIFDELALSFATTPAANQTIREDYEDAFQVRLGAEHRLPKWTYRFGYYFDQHAAPTESVSPLLPDTDRHGLSVGLGLPLPWGQGAMLDLYELAIFPVNVSTEGRHRDGFNGEYDSFINAAGIGLRFTF